MNKIFVNIICLFIPIKKIRVNTRNKLLNNITLETLTNIKQSLQHLEALFMANKKVLLNLTNQLIDIGKIKNSTDKIHWLSSDISNIKLNTLRFHEFLGVQESLTQYGVRKINKDNLELFFKYKILDDVRCNVFDSIINEVIHSKGYKLKDSIIFADNDIVIDMGANIGIFSIYLAKKYPNIKIYSFEPGQENYELLLVNIKLNNVKNVFPIQKAVGNYNGKTTIEQTTSWGALAKELIQDKSLLGSQFLVNEVSNYSYSQNANIVEMITFDKVFELLNIEKCKYLKVDCEGGEIGLLNTTIFNKVEYATVGVHFHNETNEQIFDICKKHISENKLELQVG